MDPPLRTLLEPEARCPRGPASHRRRPPRQDRQARRPTRAQQAEEEEMNATIYPPEADYPVDTHTHTVPSPRVAHGTTARVCHHSQRNTHTTVKDTKSMQMHRALTIT